MGNIGITRREPGSAWLVFGDGPGMGRVARADGVISVCTAPGEVLVFDGAGTGIDMSDAWVLFEVSGAKAGAALATIVPVDLHPEVFGVGCAAATVAAHVPVLVWREATGFVVGCRRSYAAWFDRCLAGMSGT